MKIVYEKSENGGVKIGARVTEYCCETARLEPMGKADPNYHGQGSWGFSVARVHSEICADVPVFEIIPSRTSLVTQLPIFYCPFCGKRIDIEPKEATQ